MNILTQPQRFLDRWELIEQFKDELLVTCPRCSQCGVIRRIDPSSTNQFAPRRFTCPHCGMTRYWKNDDINRNWRESPQDDYFQLPLWLQASCCGHVLWAYNARHLQFIRDYVGSTLRERRRRPGIGWNNSSLASRLPRWMKLAKNRDDILKTIEKLQEKFRDAEPDRDKTFDQR